MSEDPKTRSYNDLLASGVSEEEAGEIETGLSALDERLARLQARLERIRERAKKIDASLSDLEFRLDCDPAGASTRH